MRRVRRVTLFGLVSALLVGFVGSGEAYAAQAAPLTPPRTPAHHTYTVFTGSENVAQGVELEAYFPAALHIHAGDTVLWRQNTNEIHTVTFLAGSTAPALTVPAPSGAPAPLMFNQQAAFPD